MILKTHVAVAGLRKHSPFARINSVILADNVDEDMTEAIKRLQPIRWKVFQCLLIEGENAGEDLDFG